MSKFMPDKCFEELIKNLNILLPTYVWPLNTFSGIQYVMLNILIKYCKTTSLEYVAAKTKRERAIVMMLNEEDFLMSAFELLNSSCPSLSELDKIMIGWDNLLKVDFKGSIIKYEEDI